MSNNKQLKEIHNRYIGYTPPKAGVMSGDYIKEMAEAARISALSGGHMYLIGAPGWGKTATLHNMGHRYANGAMVKVTATPQLDESAFAGIKSVKARMEDRQETVLDGTPLDPSKKLFVVDEFSRLNPFTIQAAIHALDPQVQSHCTIWTTNNHALEDEIFQAVYDRFLVVCYVSPSNFNLEEVGRAFFERGHSKVAPFWMPSLDEVEAIRLAKPTEPAFDAMTKVVASLCKEIAINTSLSMSKATPRMAERLYRLLWPAAVLETGTSNFLTIPPRAVRYLRFAFPAQSHEEYNEWVKIVDKESLVQGVSSDAVEVMRHTEHYFAKFEQATNLGNKEAIQKEVMAIRAEFSKVHADLSSRFGATNSNVLGLKQRFEAWVVAAVQGKKIELF